MYGNCSECRRLWDEYSQASKDQIALVESSQQSEVDQNRALLQQLATLKLLVGERRSNVCVAMQEHEATHKQKSKTE